MIRFVCLTIIDVSVKSLKLVKGITNGFLVSKHTSLADGVTRDSLNKGGVLGGTSGREDETELLPEGQEYGYHV